MRSERSPLAARWRLILGTGRRGYGTGDSGTGGRYRRGHLGTGPAGYGSGYPGTGARDHGSAAACASSGAAACDGRPAAWLAGARGALNMAVDEALLESVQSGAPPVLRFYTWNPACLSLGRNQPARDLYDLDRAAAAGIEIVRRPTGGLAVLHDRELTYSVLTPIAPFGGPRAAYMSINRALVEGLRRFGISAEQAAGVRARGRLHRPSEPCFQTPSAGEVVARARKLVGSAQRCERGALLQHGSILLSGSQARVLDLLARPSHASGAHEGSITLEELMGRQPPVPDLVDAICGGFEQMFGTRLAPGRLDQRESARAEQLAARYGAGEWTWRR